MKNSEETVKTALTRRSFLQGASVSAMGLAAAGFLGGCAPKEKPAETETTADKGMSEQGKKWSVETAPQPIADSAIVETVEADIVIVGAGTAGITAAYTAIQAGASVAILQNSTTWITHGWSTAGINSAYQKEHGIEFDANELQATYAKLNGGKADERILKIFMDNSGEAVDWLMAEAPEVKVVGMLGNPAFAHAWEGQQMGILEAIINKAIKGGAKVHYETEGVQLVREGDRVTSVIGHRTADNKDEYVKFNAKKGVLLATGDYSNDPEMVEAFAPFCVGLANTYFPPTNQGGGHKMAMWIGAAIDKAAHAPMIHFDPSPLPEGDAPLSGTPWLAVNKLGERFQNEDTDYPYIVNQCILQPDSTRFQICDNDYAAHWNNFGGDFMRWTVSHENQKEWDDALSRGSIIKADTLEELAKKLELPEKTFTATVKRYNELVDKGVDEDFGKKPAYLIESKIEKAPFYGIKRVPGVLTILGGLHVNKNLQVLDLESQPITGLYAAGNASGNFFGNDYPLYIGAASCGRAVTFGRYAAQKMLAAQ